MDELKKVFDAARKIRGHYIKDAAEEMGYSETTINKFFAGEYPYPDRVKEAIRNYIYESGLVESFRELGLDPDTPKSKIAAGSQ